MSKFREKKAFTIIELIVVIAILGVLVLLAVPRFLDYVEETKIAQIQSDVKTLETIIGPEMATNEDYPESSGWTTADNSELDKHQATNSLFNREGRVEDGSVNLDKIYYELPSNTFNSELKGQFYASQGGEIYYHDESFEEKLETKTVSMNFNESLEREQTHTFTLPRLIDLENIKVDNGELDILNVKGNEVTVRVKDGNISKQEVASGEYIPEESKEVEGQTSEFYDKDGFTGQLEEYVYSGEYTPAQTKVVEGHDSAEYNVDGYVGNLTRYLESGVYIPADTKSVTNQTSANYDKDGYKGTLSQYVHSGSYTPADTKYVTGQTSRNYSDSSGYSGTLSSYVYSGSYTAGESRTQTASRSSSTRSGLPSSISYNSGGFSGTLSGQGITTHSVANGGYYRDLVWDEVSYCMSIGWPSTGMCGNGVWVPTYTTEYRQTYSGTVTKPAVDTRVYRYRGDVTKPASDTRVYRYQGEVTKPASDTRVYKYEGTVTKPASDTREYRYRGNVVKPESDTRIYNNYYQYNITIDYK